MYLLYICFDDSLVVYTVNPRVQNKLGKLGNNLEVKRVPVKLRFRFLFSYVFSVYKGNL